MNSPALAAPLLAWYRRERRDLPWRRLRDPYSILVSEVMLQQTRVEVVIPYYERFLARFPSAAALAEASLEDVYEAWAGLGYYRRARNLQATARATLERGGFPQTEPELQELPGVGPYTAAALASIAWGKPAVALDGNALRVLARWWGVETPVARPSTQALLRKLTLPEIPADSAGDFTQAVMELGARVCVPRQPRCLLCPLASDCRARLEGRLDQIPAVAARRSREAVSLHAFRIVRDGRVWLEQRPDAPFLADQWVTPWHPESEQEAQMAAYLLRFPGSSPRRLGSVTHGVTFRDLTVHVWTWETTASEGATAAGGRWSDPSQPVPRLTRKVLDAI